MRSSSVFGAVVAIALLVAVVVTAVAYDSSGAPRASTAAPGPTRTPPPVTGPPVLVGAGDIASCDGRADEATAALVAAIDGTVFTTGDNAYENGSRSDYADCYGPTWGIFRDRTRPVPGNHEYQTRGAAGYFEYFAELAATPGEGWYAYDIGTWRVYALNSNCSLAGGCAPGSRQLTWLQADLAANPRDCVAAYWHHPRFSSGRHGDHPSMAPIWETLHAARADVVLAGHDHSYERFAPLGPGGDPDPEAGMRQFVVGTGGEHLYEFRAPRPGSEIRNADTFGVLQLILGDGRYEWRFLSASAGGFSDTGSASCH